jgi:alpha-glucosidase
MKQMTVVFKKDFLIGVFSATILLINVAAHATPGIKVNCSLLAPDKNTKIEIGIDATGNLLYRAFYHQKMIITWSNIGFVINGKTAGEHTVITQKTVSAHRGSFAWRLGEDDSISNDYNQVLLICRSDGLNFNLILRVFNGSIAFRYQIPSQPQFNAGEITKELTTFVFSKVLTVYQYNQESVFVPVKISLLKKSCDLPATLTDYKNTYVSIGEADNDNYTKTELTKGEAAHSLQVSFRHDSAVVTTKNYTMPWRTISFSNTAIGLHACSQLYLKLVKPLFDSIPAWVKPGKLIRSGLSAQSAIRCIDFAAKHNLQYILFDAGWYGKEFNSISNPTTYIRGLDIPAIVKYGKSKGIGVILYVNYVGLRKYLDAIIPLYKKWGVAGMKFGFVDGLTQDGIKWLVSAVRKATDAGFIIDVHDNYKPTGLSRKYPGWLTQEGIRGDEHGPDAIYTTTLPFTRFLAGPADFTFCYPNSTNSYSKNLKVSMAHQLALTVIYFSPLQSMFWYGKPEDYANEEEIEFFKYVPTVWDESHYLAGEIGQYISVARRKGNVWFIGNAAGLKGWKGSIELDFLKTNTVYEASIYEDDGKGGISKRVVQFKKGEDFPIDIKAKGGQAIIMRPLKDNQKVEK